MAVKIIGRDGQERKQGDTSSWSSPSKNSSSSSQQEQAAQEAQKAQAIQQAEELKAKELQANKQTLNYSTVYQQQNEKLQQQMKAVEQERAKVPLLEKAISTYKTGYERGRSGNLSIDDLKDTFIPGYTAIEAEGAIAGKVVEVAVDAIGKDRLKAYTEGYKAGKGESANINSLQAPAQSTDKMITHPISEWTNKGVEYASSQRDALAGSLPEHPATRVLVGLSDYPLMWAGALGNVPLGVETIVRNPTTVKDSIGLGAGMMAGEIVKTAEQDPWRSVGQIISPKVTPKVTNPVIKATAERAGEATGLVRTKTFVAGTNIKDPGNKLPYKSMAEQVETVFENDFISGARGVSTGIRRVGEQSRVRDPASKGDVGAGAKGIFMTIASKDIEPVGSFTQNAPITQKGVYLIDQVRNVKVPEELKLKVYESIRTKGEFKEYYPEIIRLAKEQNAIYEEPIAIPSPKRAEGFMHPENEVYLVAESEFSRTITSESFAGFTTTGARIVKIRYGNQPKLQTNVLQSITENISYNWDIGISRKGIYRKGHLNSMVADMNRRTAELNGEKLSYLNAYDSIAHGPLHAGNVERNMLNLGVDSKIARIEANLHDVAKIGSEDTGPLEHGLAAEIAINTGKFTTSELEALSPSERALIAKDIGTHTSIKPLNLHNIPSGLHTILFDRPSPTGKALATADRIDLSRFGIEVKQSKLFFKPGETIISHATTGKQTLFSDTTAELFPLRNSNPIGGALPETSVPSKGLVTAEEIFASTNYEIQGSKGLMPEINIPTSPSSSVRDPVGAYKDPFRSPSSGRAYEEPIRSSSSVIDPVEAYKDPFRSSSSGRAYEDPLRYSSSVIDPVRAYKDPFGYSRPSSGSSKYISISDKNILDYKPIPNKPDYTPIPPKSNNYTPPPPNPDTYTPPPPNPDTYTPPPPNPDTYTPPPPNPDTYTPPPPNPDTYTPPPPNPFSSELKWDIDPFENQPKRKKTKKKMLKNEYGDPFNIKNIF